MSQFSNSPQVSPEQAVLAHKMVGGKVLLPIHWGLFALASHSWTEPIERTLIAAKSSDINLIAPKPGESVEPELNPKLSPWWPETQWTKAEEDPIISSQMK